MTAFSERYLLRGFLVLLLLYLAFMSGRYSCIFSVPPISRPMSTFQPETAFPSANQQLGRSFDLIYGRKQMEMKVTFLVFSFKESQSCLRIRIESIFAQYPHATTIVASSATYNNPLPFKMKYFKSIQSEGQALEMMTSMVKTEYFLYLTSGAHLPDQNSNNSVSWLLHALTELSHLDFVGGSYLREIPGVKYPVLEVPCHRLRLCNWTMSQSFEYKYSIGDMMVCEETSPSFMGRTSSLSKVGPFDSNLPTMATTDYFLRGKGKILTGLRPEVSFRVSQACFPARMSTTKEADIKMPFMRKYELVLLRDSFGREVKATDSREFSSLVNDNFRWWKQGTYASPLYIRGLQLHLQLAADFLESQNIKYYIDAGIALGGLKMRGILPWDRDVDVIFYGDSRSLRGKLEKYVADQGIQGSIQFLDAISPDQNMHVELGPLGYADWYDNRPYDADNATQLMYIDVHGRRYPVLLNLMAYFREHYGQNYLEMHREKGLRQTCRMHEGHHACLPKQYSIGGGHWREFYCDL